jgi:dephospho-CoA kinase
LQYDATILVTAPVELRLQRVVARDGLSIQEIEKRIQTQWPDEQKKICADFIIENDGRAMLKQIEAILNRLLKDRY